MLERAKEKAFQAGLKIDFIEADIRGLNLEEKFDLIFISFNSIHHLYKNEDLFDTLKVVRNHLKEKGLFWTASTLISNILLKTSGSNRLLPNIQPMMEEKY